jgi:hypothetical protein
MRQVLKWLTVAVVSLVGALADVLSVLLFWRERDETLKGDRKD